MSVYHSEQLAFLLLCTKTTDTQSCVEGSLILCKAHAKGRNSAVAAYINKSDDFIYCSYFKPVENNIMLKQL